MTDRFAGCRGDVACDFGVGHRLATGQVIGRIDVIFRGGKHDGGGLGQIIARDIGDFCIACGGAKITGFKRMRHTGHQQIGIEAVA